MTSLVDVSIVIPVHDGESFVRDAIDSVLAQEGLALEVIVVDNGSTDRTRSVVEQTYGSSVTLVAESKPGPANARNTGCRLATGEYLAFLDADDIWLPGKLRQQFDAWRNQPDAALVFTLCAEFHSPEMDTAQRERYPCRTDPYPLPSACSLLCRRDTFRRIGAFPDIPGGEFIAWFGWAKELGLRPLMVPEVLVRRRIHAGNHSRTARMKMGYALAAKWLLDQKRRRSEPEAANT